MGITGSEILEPTGPLDRLVVNLEFAGRFTREFVDLDIPARSFRISAFATSIYGRTFEGRAFLTVSLSDGRLLKVEAPTIGECRTLMVDRIANEVGQETLDDLIGTASQL